jgi:hypothetical protein
MGLSVISSGFIHKPMAVETCVKNLLPLQVIDRLAYSKTHLSKLPIHEELFGTNLVYLTFSFLIMVYVMPFASPSCMEPIYSLSVTSG